MKAIHGGKAKNDRIDAHKIAVLLRGGMIPEAYVYPEGMRHRAELLAHVQNTNHQYNLPDIGRKISYRANREGVAERFADPSVRSNVTFDLKRIGFYDGLLNQIELEILRHAKQHDANTFHLLDSVPGVGKILALVILYEIHDIRRFPSVQDFASYCRLVKTKKESAGKTYGFSGTKIGNAHLKWAFSEAAVGFLRNNSQGQAYLAKLENKHGKGKALSVLAHKIGRAVYYMLWRKEAFDIVDMERHG